MRRRRDLTIDEEEKEEAEDGVISEKWSWRKILIGCFVILFVACAIFYTFLKYKRYQEAQGNNILGVTESAPQESLPTEEDVKKTLNTVQNEIDKIDPGNLFSSQKSIQKIIEDLETLRKTTLDPKNAFCSALCGEVKTPENKKATNAAESE